jgi:mono/diheme cytochrome c family protein
MIAAMTLTLAVVVTAGAQQAQPARQGATPRAGSEFDEAAVKRGEALMVAHCGFCHGISARGGAGGPDLTRSELVQNDENGKQLGEFLKVGRPELNMPKFDLTDQEVSDLATYLHATIHLAANRRLYQILDILTGDPKAGEAFFNGAGKCSACHSPSGDLKGIGAKYDPATLQGRIVIPRGGGGPGGGAPPYLDRNALEATVTSPSGESVTGALVRLTDFEVTLHDPSSGELRSWLRNGSVPKVVVTDPLQAHVDMWTRWTDEDMHNVTAYLASLK